MEIKDAIEELSDASLSDETKDLMSQAGETHLYFQRAWLMSCLNRYFNQTIDLNDPEWVDFINRRVEKDVQNEDGVKVTRHYLDGEWLLTSLLWVDPNQERDNTLLVKSQFMTKFGDDSAPDPFVVTVGPQEANTNG